MRTYVFVAASAVLLAALIVQLYQRLFPGNYWALLLIAFLAFAINGLVGIHLARRESGQRRPRPSKKPSRPRGKREEGTVKWFNRGKGFGFIIRQSGEEIFVHQRHVHLDDDNRRPALRDGQKVSYQVVEREKGLQAESVAPL